MAPNVRVNIRSRRLPVHLPINSLFLMASILYPLKLQETNFLDVNKTLTRTEVNRYDCAAIPSCNIPYSC